MYKAVTPFTRKVGEIVGIAGVGQSIEVHDADVGIGLEDMADKIAADEPAAACD